MQKYVGAMVRKSIRVVLVAENDLLEVGSDPGAEQPRRSSLGRLGRCRAVLGGGAGNRGNLGFWNPESEN